MKKILISVITVILFGTMIFAENKQEKPKPQTQQKEQGKKTPQADQGTKQAAPDAKTAQTSKVTSSTSTKPTAQSTQTKPTASATSKTATTTNKPTQTTSPTSPATKPRRSKKTPKTPSSTTTTPAESTATTPTPAALPTTTSVTPATTTSEQTTQTQPTQPVSSSCQAIPPDVVQGGSETDLGRVYISKDFVHADTDYKKGNYHISMIEKDGKAWFKVFNNKKEFLFSDLAVVKAHEAKGKQTKLRVRKEFLKNYEYFRVTVIKPDTNLMLYFMVKQKEAPATTPATTTTPKEEKPAELKIEEIEL